MTTKAEAESAIRQMVREWARLKGVRVGQAEMPQFSDFYSWAIFERYEHYFNFRSTMGPMEDAERWFDDELGQSWRN